MSRRRARPDSARALALLAVYPVPATDARLPRFHFSKPLGDGSIIATDRAVMTRFLLYTAKTQRQFDGGHRAQAWYVRPAGDVGNAPKSRPFATFAAAAEAILDGSWDLTANHADRRPIRVRYS